MARDERNMNTQTKREPLKSEDARDRQMIADGIDLILRKAAPRKGRAILFGSRARGDARSDSDWDVLILLDKERITDADMDEISLVSRPDHEAPPVAGAGILNTTER